MHLIWLLNTKLNITMDSALASGANRAALHSLYRRLRRHGEDETMIRRALETHSLELNLVTAAKLLRLHTRALYLLQRRQAIPIYNLPSKVINSFQRRKLRYEFLAIRLNLKSWAAIKDVLTTLLFFSLCFMFYQMYRVCRIGLEMADEKYRLLSIPVIQTIEALEMAERRKDLRRKEMEHDMEFERGRK